MCDRRPPGRSRRRRGKCRTLTTDPSNSQGLEGYLVVSRLILTTINLRAPESMIVALKSAGTMQLKRFGATSGAAHIE